MSTLSSEELAGLGRHRWAVAVLAFLHARGGARFVELSAQLGIASESLSRTLGGLIDDGWAMRNPGHGHPLRPEYILTDKGRHVAPVCVALVAAQAELGIAPTSLPRWSLPVLMLVGNGAGRYGEIERGLPQSNPRALVQTLKLLSAQGLVDRQIVDAWPPVATYALSQSGARIAEALQAD